MGEMSFGLKDYLVENKEGFLTLDIERLMELSNKKFKKKYLEENVLFINNHLKLTGHPPVCEYCEGIIERPGELVREHGGSSHVYCFEPIYNNDLRDKFCEEERKYFDRVVETLKIARPF